MSDMKRIVGSLILALFYISVAAQSGFTMWQIPSHVNTIGNSYVFRTDKGKVIVMDGGTKDETLFLKGFIAALGNEVEAWIVSHPHDDHVGALTAILENPQGMKIHKIYHSRFSTDLLNAEADAAKSTMEFYNALDTSHIKVINLTKPGLTVKIDGLNFKILSVTNEELRINPYNNSSMIVRVWDKRKSIVFLGDAGVECGNKVLNSPYRKDLDCDYLQVAHHGIYVRTDNSNGALRALQKEFDKMNKSDVESKVYSEYDDHFQTFAWIALVLLVLDIFTLDRKNRIFRKIKLFS